MTTTQLELNFEQPKQQEPKKQEPCIHCKIKPQEPDSWYCKKCWPNVQRIIQNKIDQKKEQQKYIL